MRRLTLRILADPGYSVLEAENAAVVARILATGPVVGLLFTDIVMPASAMGMSRPAAPRSAGQA